MPQNPVAWYFFLFARKGCLLRKIYFYCIPLHFLNQMFQDELYKGENDSQSPATSL
jgi:hypothetical protein